MNNLLAYDDFINEGIISNVKEEFNKIKIKIRNAWDKLDFQKREFYLRKIYKYLVY